MEAGLPVQGEVRDDGQHERDGASEVGPSSSCAARQGCASPVLDLDFKNFFDSI
jgi:hypothetical protein